MMKIKKSAIAGKFEKLKGRSKRQRQPIFFDVELKQNKQFSFSIPKSHNSFVYLVDGGIKIGNQPHDNIQGSKLVLLTNGNNLKVSAETNAKFLLIAGEPIGKSIARGGPFVMNTKSEIIQALMTIIRNICKIRTNMSIYDIEVKDIDMNSIKMEELKGKSLIVNVASACGFTPQYTGLQNLYDKYKDKGRNFSISL